MIRPDKGTRKLGEPFGANPNLVVNGIQIYGPKGHDGQDILTRVGDKLYAPRSGKVTQIDTNKLYGLRLRIKNAKGTSYLGHLSKVLVKSGQTVEEGQVVALAGATGNITGPHTHWGEYNTKGVAVNPLTVLGDDMYKGHDAKYWYEQYQHKAGVSKVWHQRYTAVADRIKKLLPFIKFDK